MAIPDAEVFSVKEINCLKILHPSLHDVINRSSRPGQAAKMLRYHAAPLQPAAATLPSMWAAWNE